MAQINRRSSYWSVRAILFVPMEQGVRIHHLTPDGATVKTLPVDARLYDINISRKGELAMGGLGTFYYRTTTALNAVQRFDQRDLPNLGLHGRNVCVSFEDDEP